MKQTILAIVMTVVASPAFADGFRPWDDQTSNGRSEIAESSVRIDTTPWYLRGQGQIEPSTPDFVQREIAATGPYYQKGQS